MAENYNAFAGLNLSDARMENETREEYKKRLKLNGKVMKIYFKVGREQFQQMFPEGINYDMFKQPVKEEVVEEIDKIPTKGFGEAK